MSNNTKNPAPIYANAASQLANNAVVKATAQARLQNTSNYTHAGLARVSSSQWDEIIERIRAGDIISNITKDYGLSCGAIHVKVRENEDFRNRFYEAIDDAMMTFALECNDVASGGEASSGDVQRDRLIVDTRMKLAAKLSKRLADRATVQADTIQVVVNPDWGAGDF